MEVTLPNLPAPIANYVPAKRAGNLVFTAGQVSAVEGRAYKGKLGATLSLELLGQKPRQSLGGLGGVCPHPSRIPTLPFVVALLLVAGGAGFALALQARSMGLIPLTIGIAMSSFVAMWTLMVAAMKK
jgi:hypothetical protein